MYWCKIVAALLGCHQVLRTCTTSPSSVALDAEQVKVVNAFVENLAPPTVTVTVGIIATPVVHSSAAAPVYHTAAPGAIPSYHQHDDTSLPTISNVPLSYHDTIIAVSDFIENASFEIKVTPLRLIMAFFMLNCVHLVCMILYGDFKLPYKAVKCLVKGYSSGSKVLWTVLFAASMFLSYDTLPENPVTLAVTELLFLNDTDLDIVARFVRSNVLSWRHFRYHSPFPERPTALWLLEELFGEIYESQQRGKFVPKTLTEVLVGALVALYRLACAHYKLMDTPGAAIRPRIKAAGLALLGQLPSIKQIIAFTPILWNWLQACLRYGHKQLIRPVLRFFFVVGCNIFQRNLGGRLDESKVGSWDYMDALMSATTLTRDGIAKLILRNITLETKLTNALQEARRLATLEAQADMKKLGERCVSWRTSHVEMAKDYNHCRRTLDLALTLYLVQFMGQDPLGFFPRRNAYFRSNHMILVDEPGKNGLHYRPNPYFKSGPCGRITKDQCEAAMDRIIWAKRSKQKPVPIEFPAMDVFDKQSWCIDLARIGFAVPGFAPESNPMDLRSRQAKPSSENQMEDYAAAGRMKDWDAEEPERLKLAQKLAHPFYSLDF